MKPATTSWWADQWMALYHTSALAPPYNVNRVGRKPAGRVVRVLDIDIEVGTIEARVRSREKGIGSVTIRLAVFSDEQWRQVIEALASQAFFAAQLLVGELPLEIDQVFEQVGVSLLPASAQELSIECSLCPVKAEFCPPVLAVFERFAEMLNRNPWLLFQVRGRDQDHILQALREERLSARTVDQAATPIQTSSTLGETQMVYHAEPKSLVDPGAPLATEMESFWGNAKDLEQLHHHIAPPEIQLALLRRLGYPPFSTGGSETFQSLSDIYRSVTQAALNLAYEPDDEEKNEEKDDGEV